MKITDYKIFTVDAFRTNFIFVKMETDANIYGVGEATLECNENAVKGALEDMRPYLIGKDPRQIEKHIYELYRNSYWRGGPALMSAISAVEMCMWDITARELGVPVYRLLGGKANDRVKIYANGWFSGAKTPEEFAAKAKVARAKGIRAIKWDPFGKAYRTIEKAELQNAVRCVGAVRDAVGDDMDLLIEGHGRFEAMAAVRIAQELAPMKPLFFEEPVMPDNLDALAYVRSKSPIPIAAGERIFTPYRFQELFEKRAVDVVQPDLSHVGGLMFSKKIAAMAAANYVAYAPHNPCGPITNAATLQVAACTPEFFILETMMVDVPWRREITDEQIQFEDGYIVIPDKPGLGIELREEAFLAHPYQPHALRHYTGQLTNIRPAGSIELF